MTLTSSSTWGTRGVRVTSSLICSSIYFRSISHFCTPGLLLSYPHAGHAVGLTDLSAALLRSRQFEERGVRICGMTVHKDPSDAANLAAHKQYCREIQEWSGVGIGGSGPAMFPVVIVSTDQAFGMGIPLIGTKQSAPNAPEPTVGSVTYILKPDRTVAAILQYPATSGRQYDELIRLLDSLQLHVNMTVMTPADWQSGEGVLVDSSLTDEQARDLFGSDGITLSHHDANGGGSDSTSMPRPDLPYLRWTKDPTWFAPDV
jgi:thioredoxin-dependent peroxiredoxin